MSTQMVVFFAPANVLGLAGNTIASAHGEPTIEGALMACLCFRKPSACREISVTEVSNFLSI